MGEPMALKIGDVVELRKVHPCGGRQWRILRVGLDIGAECLTCGRYILVPRLRFERDIKRFVRLDPGSDQAGQRQGTTEPEGGPREEAR